VAVSRGASSALTQDVFGAQLSQIPELEIDVNDGRAARDCEDHHVTAVDFLGEKKHRRIFV